MPNEHRPLTEAERRTRNRALAQDHDLLPSEYLDWLIRYIEKRNPRLNGTGLTRGEITGALVDLPSGQRLTYDETKAGTTINTTTEATANTIVTSTAYTFDGNTGVRIEAWFPDASSISAWTLNVVLWDTTAAASIGLWGITTLGAGTASGPQLFVRHLIPAAGSRQYSLRAFRTTADGNVNGGNGGVGAKVPVYIAIYKV